MNVTNSISLGYVRNMNSTHSTSNITSHQTKLNVVDAEQIMTLEISDEALAKSRELNIPNEITIVVPREWTIAGETARSRLEALERALKKADSLRLSFGERLDFLKKEGLKWAEDIRQNDPEMFVHWLKRNKHKIESGRADLADLPSNFTMQDYYFYVKDKDSFSVQV